MSFSIRPTKEERQLAESYAKLHAISMSEDAYDITLANDAYDEYVKSGKQSSPFSELCKELDL